MNTEPHHITVGGLWVQVVRKPIKNLHLGVYPPERTFAWPCRCA